jgi:capsid protein
MATTTRRSPILDAQGRQFIHRTETRTIRARYDSAQTTTDNTRHWSNTDALSADAANCLDVRKKLRERARYEVANNGWARSMVDTLAHEVIGTGPRIQILTGEPAADEWIELQYQLWAKRIRLGRKLRTMRKAKCQDGEGIGLFHNNAKLFGDVQLDLKTIETDQLTTPTLLFREGQIDGIDLDENGNPDRYHLLKHHPGGTEFLANHLEEIDPPPAASEVIHIFREDRPGQHRGIPEITPALPIFSRLRRFTLATLQTAENIAELTLMLKTQHPDDGNGADSSGTTDSEPSSYEAFDVFDIERGMISVLPEGTDIVQPDAKQPSSTYVEFVQQCLAEAFACVCMPYAVGASDSSKENFASGKLSRQGFKRAVKVERELEWNPEILRIFFAWFNEAKFSMPLDLRTGMKPIGQWIITVFWDGVEDIDPEKAARAREVMLKTGQTSLPDIYAENGDDYENKQQMAADSLGMKLDEYRRRLADTLFPQQVQPSQPSGIPAKQGVSDGET